MAGNRRHGARWNSLRVIMAVATLSMSLIAVLLITKIIYRYANDVVNRTIESSNAQLAESAANAIDGYIEEMVKVSANVSALLQSHSIDKLGESALLLRNDIETIAVLDEQGYPVASTSSRSMREDTCVFEQSWCVIPEQGAYSVSRPHVQRLYRGDYPWVITLLRSVSWKENGQSRRGTILVDMNFLRIKDQCTEKSGGADYLYLTDLQGNVVYHPNQQMIYAGIFPEEVTATLALNDGNFVQDSDGGTLAVAVRTLENADWRVIGVADRNGLATYTDGPGHFVAAAIVVLALGLLACSLLVSRFITQPLRHLIQLMGHISDGSEADQAPEGGIYEVGRLGATFNRMLARIRELIERVRMEQEQLHRSEIKALNAQINPHFLYNTLDSVVWLAESGDQENTVRMVMALSTYFRLSLSGARDFITVEEELRQVENYLIIQKMRFGDIFTYEFQCDEAVARVRIPKILLQPLAENAIVHGIGVTGEAGRIRICALRTEEGMELLVEDNGCGMKPELLERVLEQDPGTKSGVGLKNVNQRVKLIYGEAYGLRVESELDVGTTVHVCLPWNPDGEGGAAS